MTFREFFQTRKKIRKDGRLYKKNKMNVSVEKTEHHQNLMKKAEQKERAKIIKQQTKDAKKAAKGKLK